MADRKITLFPLGRVVATPGALDLGVPLFRYLARHGTGDWGDLCPEDRALNDQSVHEGSRLFSAYETDAGKLWIITEADRSATTFLLPSEY